LFELTDAEEAPCARDDVAGAEEAFLASTVREVQPVAAVEDVALPAGGPRTVEAAERLHARIQQELARGAPA
jgi:branched-chain amino acid aminotransferase